MSIVVQALSIVLPVEMLDALWPGGRAACRAAARKEFRGLEDRAALFLDRRSGRSHRLSTRSPGALARLLAARLEVLHGSLVPVRPPGAASLYVPRVTRARARDDRPRRT